MLPKNPALLRYFTVNVQESIHTDSSDSDSSVGDNNRKVVYNCDLGYTPVD